MTNSPIPARLCRAIDGRLVTEEIRVDLIAAMEVRGFMLSGYHDNPRTRAQLQGQPKFFGLCGPMWDGDAIRYEDPEAYRQLST